MHTQELGAARSLHSRTIDGQRSMLSVHSPEVNDNLLRLLHIQREIVVTAPPGQAAHLAPVVCLISVADETHHSSDTCTCIHQHYFSRVIVDLLFFYVCLKEDEASWWRYQFNGHQVKHFCLNPSGICCEDCIHEQLYCDSSDVTAHKRNFTTSHLQDSGGGIILAHNSKKNQW